MNARHEERPEDRPDYPGWEEIRMAPDSDGPDDISPSDPNDKDPPEPPKDGPNYGAWSGLFEIISAALGYGLEPVHEVAVTIRMMTPRQLATVGAMIALAFLGMHVPENANPRFAGWLTVVILVAGLGGLALYRED